MKIKDSTFTIVTNGFADGPAQPLKDYLIINNAKKIIMINHPLVAEGNNKHIITTYENGEINSQKQYKLPNKPPYSFIFDPFVPIKLPYSSAWFGFNNLASLRGLIRKRRGKTQKVFYWAVDFVPNRFGKNILTGVYNRADKITCSYVDGRIELSTSALEGRNKYLNLNSNSIAPTIVAPMGAWLERTPKINSQAWSKKKVLYLGHLVKRQGVNTLIQAIHLLIKNNFHVTAEIIGDGPEAANLKSLVHNLGLDNNIIFHGFITDHKDVESLLAKGSIATAPYLKDKTNFTQFADPGKLKAYLAANLPIVLTDVPPNAKDIEKAGAAIVVNDNPKALARAIMQLLSDKNKWSNANIAAAKLAHEFDWNKILKSTLNNLEIM